MVSSGVVSGISISGRTVQSKHAGITADRLDSHVGRINQRIPVCRQPVCHFCKEIVTGVLDTAHHIQWSVVSRIDPALDRRIDFLVFTGTVDGLIKADHFLFQSGNRRDRLEGRTRCFLCLGCVIVNGRAKIFLQLSHICRVRTSGETVIIVTRICDQCTNLTRIDIRDHGASGTWIQSQLRWCQFNILDLAPDKLECIFFSICRQQLNFIRVIRKQPPARTEPDKADVR